MTDLARDRAFATPRLDRRAFLRGVGAATTAGLAGCGDVAGEKPTYDLSQEEFDPAVLPYDQRYPTGVQASMFRGGLRRLGYYPKEITPDSVSVNWQFPVNYIGHNAAKSSPVVTPDGEFVVIASDTGRVHAVTPKGEQVWTTRTQATRQGFHASPIVVEGVAYVGGYDGANLNQEAAMYAFDVRTGDVLWRTDEMTGSVAIGSSAAYWEGYLFVVVEHRHPIKRAELWVFDAETGTPVFSDDRIKSMAHPTVAIDPVNERLLSGSNGGLVCCWEFPSLSFEWAYEAGDAVKGAIATYDGSAFVGSWDTNVYRLDLADGTREWAFETGNSVMCAPAIDPDAGVVYVGSDDRYVYAIDADTGEELWATDVEGRVMGAVSATDNAVLAGTTAAEMVALEKDTGELRWFTEHNGHVTSEPVPRDGRLYFAERAVVSGYWEADEEFATEVPGHAYCLVEA
jgi:outer membrane protein assembly factor BamB